jgi:SOS response regulatory protein OraA/RecX
MAKINEDVSDAQGETNLSPAPTFEDTEGKSISKRKNPYYQALVILERRDHSEWEVRTKLARKGFSAVEIDSTIEKLIKVNFIDDERFARLPCGLGVLVRVG